MVDDLAQFKDKEAFEDIKLAFANGLIDEFFYQFRGCQADIGMADKDMTCVLCFQKVRL